MGKGRSPLHLNQLMRHAKIYIREMLDRYPLFHPFIAAKTSLDTMEAIIEDKIVPTQFVIVRSDIGLLTAKSIEQIDPQNCDILHQVSFAFLSQYWPTLIHAPLLSDWDVAFKFYTQEGYDDPRAHSHLRGIDFSKRVITLTHQPQRQLQQWQVDTAKQGDYYADIGTRPTDLGINPDGQDLNGNTQPKSHVDYEVIKDIEMLKSTAKGIVDFWSVKGSPYPTSGGATQYFKYLHKDRLKQS